MSHLHVERTGSGPAIIFTHGVGGSAETWDEQVAHLSRRFTVLRWDLLGHGRSDKPEEVEAYSRETAYADLQGLIASVDGGVVLAGHSFGGYLSMCRAIREPAGIRGLVLVATGPGFRDPEARARWNRTIRAAGERLGISAAATELAVQPDAFVMSNLDAIAMPVLLIAGEKDKGFQGAISYMGKKLPTATTLSIPDAGHHVHRTHADVVNPAIDAFIDSLP